MWTTCRPNWRGPSRRLRLGRPRAGPSGRPAAGCLRETCHPGDAETDQRQPRRGGPDPVHWSPHAVSEAGEVRDQLRRQPMTHHNPACRHSPSARQRRQQDRGGRSDRAAGECRQGTARKRRRCRRDPHRRVGGAGGKRAVRVSDNGCGIRPTSCRWRWPAMRPARSATRTTCSKSARWAFAAKRWPPWRKSASC